MAFGLHKMNVGNFLKSFSALRLSLSNFSLVAGKNIASIFDLPFLPLIQTCYPSKVLANTSPICLVSPKREVKQQLQQVVLQHRQLTGLIALSVSLIKSAASL